MAHDDGERAQLPWDDTPELGLSDVVGHNYNGVVVLLDEPSGIENTFVISVAAAATAVSGWLLVKAPGAYLEAFAKKLGERHAEGFPENARALLLRSRGRRLILRFDRGGENITFVIQRDELTDTAWLALADLDELKDPDLTNAVFEWDPAERRWTRR